MIKLAYMPVTIRVIYAMPVKSAFDMGGEFCSVMRKTDENRAFALMILKSIRHSSA